MSWKLNEYLETHDQYVDEELKNALADPTKVIRYTGPSVEDYAILSKEDVQDHHREDGLYFNEEMRNVEKRRDLAEIFLRLVDYAERNSVELLDKANTGHLISFLGIPDYDACSKY